MHHGSDENWRKGIASKLNPAASVFCSDPAGRHGQPDWAVFDGFSSRDPKVDFYHGWAVAGRYCFIQVA